MEPSRQRRKPAAVRLLRLQVRIDLEHGCLSRVGVVRCHVEVSVSDLLLVQWSPFRYSVSEYDREVSIKKTSCPSRGCCSKKRNFDTCENEL
jgi:hypothetical protein